MLKALLDTERLNDVERAAFTDMLGWLEDHEEARLTMKRREWVEGRFEALELDAETGSQNLVSSGAVPRGREVAMAPVLHNRPLSPPGRR